MSWAVRQTRSCLKSMGTPVGGIGLPSHHPRDSGIPTQPWGWRTHLTPLCTAPHRDTPSGASGGGLCTPGGPPGPGHLDTNRDTPGRRHASDRRPLCRLSGTLPRCGLRGREVEAREGWTKPRGDLGGELDKNWTWKNLAVMVSAKTVEKYDRIWFRISFPIPLLVIAILPPCRWLRESIR